MSAAVRDTQPAGVVRRFLAMLYDGFLVTAVFMVGSFAFLILSDGEAVEGPLRIAYQAYLALLGLGFYAFFWLRGGQTLGLQAWQLRVQLVDGSPMTGIAVARRLLAGLLTLGPLGLVSVPFHPQARSLCDLLSGSVIVRKPS